MDLPDNDPRSSGVLGRAPWAILICDSESCHHRGDKAICHAYINTSPKLIKHGSDDSSTDS